MARAFGPLTLRQSSTRAVEPASRTRPPIVSSARGQASGTSPVKPSPGPHGHDGGGGLSVEAHQARSEGSAVPPSRRRDGVEQRLCLRPVGDHHGQLAAGRLFIEQPAQPPGPLRTGDRGARQLRKGGDARLGLGWQRFVEVGEHRHRAPQPTFHDDRARPPRRSLLHGRDGREIVPFGTRGPSTRDTAPLFHRAAFALSPSSSHCVPCGGTIAWSGSEAARAVTLPDPVNRKTQTCAARSAPRRRAELGQPLGDGVEQLLRGAGVRQDAEPGHGLQLGVDGRHPSSDVV